MSTELVTGNVWSSVHAAARTYRKKYAAVAFVGADGPKLLSKFGQGDVLVCNMGRKALRDGSTNPDAIETLMGRGVAVYSQENLHAKVYVLGSIAFIGSANVSANAASRLIEAMLRTTERSLVADARNFILAQCRDATEVDDACLKLARSLYRPPRGCPKSKQVREKEGGSPSVRLSIFGIKEAEPPRLVRKHFEDNHGSLQRKAGPEAKWSISILWDDDPSGIRRDQWLMLVKAGSDLTSPPMKVLDCSRLGGRSAQIVTWYRVPNKKNWLPWDEVSGHVLACAGRPLKIGRIVKDVSAVDALFALWGLSPHQ